ncbi:MAG: PAS domain S-box protein, partial [Burkholderiales bacterium]
MVGRWGEHQMKRGADVKDWRRHAGAIFRGLRGANVPSTPPAAIREAAEAVWLQEVQALTSTGSIAWNFATGEMQWSPETYRVCGVASDAPLSRELILTLVHPEDMPAYLAAVTDAIKSKTRFDHELRIVRPAGDIRTLQMVGRFLDEQPEQFVGALTDVTERKKEEEARRNSEFHYRNMFVAMAASFWELDFSGVSVILRDLKSKGVKDFAAHFRDNPDVVRAMTRATRVIDVNDQTVAMFGRGDKTELIRDVEPFWTDISLQVYA